MNGEEQRLSPSHRCRKQQRLGVYSCVHPVFVAFPAWAAVRRYSNKAATVPICWDLVFNKRNDFVEKPFSRTAGTQLPEILSVEF